MTTQPTSILPGSILDVSKSRDTAVAMLNAKVLAVCDRSGSMTQLARGGKACYEIEDEVITKLQARHPGQVALMAFNDVAFLCLDGKLPLPNGNTNMLDALDRSQPFADMGLRIVFITDGEPSHDKREVLDRAKNFRGKMDTIFVGPETSPGAEFLERLAKSVNGSHAVCDLNKESKLLEQHLETLLLKAG